MQIEYFIAKKLSSSEGRSFSRLIIRIAIAAVAISVAVMICSTSLIAGFKKEISNKIFGFWGHIHITDNDVSINSSILDVYPVRTNQDFYPSLDTIKKVRYFETISWLGQELDRELETEGGIRHIQVYALCPGILEVKSKDKKADSEIEGIILKGVSKDFDWEFLSDYILEGSPIELTDTAFSRDILISKQTSQRLRIGVGDTFTFYFVERGEQLRRRFKVCGIYKTGLDEYDKRFALVDIRQLQRLLGWRQDEVGGFEVFVEDIDDLGVITDYIYYEKVSNDFYVESIQDKMREIFEWLELQDINEVVILILMIIVAIINMVTALMILILERTNMIGTLKALGSNNWSIQKVFLYFAAYITAMGLFWGNILGLGLCLLQDQFGIITLDETNYYLSVAPVDFNFWSILMINIGTLFITLVFLVIPSYLVTTISPVKAIRFK